MRCNINFLGRKGKITELLKNMSSIESIEEKKEFGKKINELKFYCENTLTEKKKLLSDFGCIRLQV